MESKTVETTVNICCAVFLVGVIIGTIYLITAETMKVGAPYGFYRNEGKGPFHYETMVNAQDWADMSRGLNGLGTLGYAPYMRTLSEMEKSRGGDIEVDPSEGDITRTLLQREAIKVSR